MPYLRFAKIPISVLRIWNALSNLVPFLFDVIPGRYPISANLIPKDGPRSDRMNVARSFKAWIGEKTKPVA
jgi:hypothetical protein